MKKEYVTPEIAIEHYEVTQAIASCVTKIGLLSSDCVKNDPDATTGMKDLAWSGFFTDEGNCESYAIGMDGYDSICYHTNASAAFSS